MMEPITRRRWLMSAAAAVAAAPACAEEPRTAAQPSQLAAAQLPVTSRSIRLRSVRETPLVVTAIAADPRGELLAAAGDDHLIRVLRAATLSELQTIDGHRDLVRTLCFDSSGNRLVSAGNDGQLLVWDREQEFKLQQRWEGTPALARVCCAHDGSSIAAVGFSNEVYVIGEPFAQHRLACDCRDLRAIAYRDDGRLLAVAGRSGELHLFDPVAGRLIVHQPLHQSRIHDLVFHTGSSRLICVAADGRVTVFDCDRQAVVHDLAVTTSKLFAVAVLNDTLIATAGSDNAIYLVDTQRGEVVRTLTGHHGSVSTLAAAGDWLFSGSYDATLQRWPIAAIAERGQRIAEGDLRLDR